MKWRERKKTYDKQGCIKRKLSTSMVTLIVFLTSFTAVFVIFLPDVADASDDWIGIDGNDHYSSCGNNADRALNGTVPWICGVNEAHELILDLGQSYTIRKVRGRSNTDNDPTSVNIYISDSLTSWGTAVVSSITTWQDTINWVEADINDKDGRFIKINITSTESAFSTNYLEFGNIPSFMSIFDAYGDAYPNVDLCPNIDLAGVTQQWTMNPPPEMYHSQEVDDPVGSPDDDATYVYTTNYVFEDFHHETADNLETATITNVRVVARMKATDPEDRANIQLRIGIGGNRYGQASGGLTTSWADYHFDWDVNPEGSRPWTKSDIDDLQTTIQPAYFKTLGDTIYCTQIYMVVEYINASFTSSEATPDTSSVVTFNGSQSGGDVNWTWDFNNDGTPDDYGETTTYSFAKAGIYTVNLTIRDTDGHENSYLHPTYTVKQNISLAKNSNNNGVNYITWGANTSLMASTLATHLGLGAGDYIEKFNKTSGDWDYLYNVESGMGDFLINRWDHIQIDLNSSSQLSHSFTPDSGCSDPQNAIMNFTSNNKGYNYITWNRDSSITPELFIDTLETEGEIANGEDITIYVYDPTTNDWNSYKQNRPAVFNTLTSIQTYDVICFQAPNHTNVTYNPDSW